MPGPDEYYDVTKGEAFQKFYAKGFLKKYHNRWTVTCESLMELCKRIDNVYQLEQCDIIKQIGSRRLLKIDFAIPKTGESHKTAGCRLIAVSDEEELTVEMLIVYYKVDIEHINKSETLAWKSLVSTEYPKHRDLVS